MKDRKLEAETEKILKGLELAYEKMVKFKKEKGTPLVVSDNGSVKLIPANEILPTTMYMR